MYQEVRRKKYSLTRIDQPVEWTLGSLYSNCRVLPLDHKRLEDRIHALLAKAVETTDPEKLEPVVTQLRSALNDHIRRLREMAVCRPGSPRRRETD